MSPGQALDDVRGRGAIPLWPDTGRILGIGKDATYAAARAGEIPTLRFGRRILVPVPKLLAMLGEAPTAPEHRSVTGPT